MIPQTWVEKQVFSLPLAELKIILGRKRLKINRFQIVSCLMAFAMQQKQSSHFKEVYRHDFFQKETCVGYAGFMYGLGLVAPLWRHLMTLHQRQAGIGFDRQTIVDSSLLPCKDEQHITSKDWVKKRVTVRKKDERSVKICGEKILTFINSKNQIVENLLFDHINCPDQSVLKNPMQWAQKGLRNGVLLADRGFSNKKVYEGLAFLRQTLPGFDLEMISPPHPKQTWTLRADQQDLYKKRWRIEEVYRQLKDPMGRFRLNMRGVRRKVLRSAKVALTTLAWNMEHA